MCLLPRCPFWLGLGEKRAIVTNERAFVRPGGGGALPSHTYGTLGWAMRQKLCHMAFATAKLYFILLVFLFSSILRILGKEMVRSVVGLG